MNLRLILNVTWWSERSPMRIRSHVNLYVLTSKYLPTLVFSQWKGRFGCTTPLKDFMNGPQNSVLNNAWSILMRGLRDNINFIIHRVVLVWNSESTERASKIQVYELLHSGCTTYVWHHQLHYGIKSSMKILKNLCPNLFYFRIWIAFLVTVQSSPECGVLLFEKWKFSRVIFFSLSSIRFRVSSLLLKN